MTRMIRWVAEGSAVAALAAVCWWSVHPALGTAIASAYVILIANSTGESEDEDAGDR